MICWQTDKPNGGQQSIPSTILRIYGDASTVPSLLLENFVPIEKKETKKLYMDNGFQSKESFQKRNNYVAKKERIE